MKNKKITWVRRYVVLIILFFFWLVPTIILLLQKSHQQKTEAIRVIAANPSNIPQNKKVPYSNDEMHKFWDAELKELIENQLALGKLPYPEINDRYLELSRKIIERTGKPLYINRSVLYHHNSVNIEGAVGLETNTIKLELYIPSVMDTFNAFKLTGQDNLREYFLTHVLVLFMHEMEHTVSDLSNTKISEKEESRAWMETCKFTIDPLVRLHGKSVVSTERKLYNAWLLDPGNQMSSEWQKALHSSYGSFF